MINIYIATATMLIYRSILMFLIFSALNNFVAFCLENETVIVRTNLGDVVGKYLKVSISIENSEQNAYVKIFQGIPYAQPPIGTLRFKAPVEVTPWNGTLLALQPKQYCMQIPFSYNNYSLTESELSEDCLYLTIWVPSGDQRNMAVMAYVFGSGFRFGPHIDYNFEKLSAMNNVIVVLMNYRLGAFGMLYLKDEECPGNMGLMDQEMAFKWIQKNIDKFGGDPDKVTIVGHSSGSMSVEYHLLNPKSRHLYKRAIMMSGFITKNTMASCAFKTLNNSLKIATQVGCANSSQNIKSTMECLRIIDSRVLAEVSIAHKLYPVLDENLTLEMTLTLPSMKDKDVIIGLVSDDGAYTVRTKLYEANMSANDVFNAVAEGLFGNISGDTLRSIRYYYKDHCNQIQHFEEDIFASRLDTDASFICPIYELADILAKAGIRTYLYYWTHRPLLSESPVWIDASHGDELQFLLGNVNFLKGNEEVQLSNRFMRYFGNFVKHGDPNLNSIQTNTFKKPDEVNFLTTANEIGSRETLEPEHSWEMYTWNNEQILDTIKKRNRVGVSSYTKFDTIMNALETIEPWKRVSRVKNTGDILITSVSELEKNLIQFRHIRSTKEEDSSPTFDENEDVTETIEEWPVYTFEKKERIEIDLHYSRKADGALREDHCHFWNYDFPLIAGKICNLKNSYFKTHSEY